MSRLEHITLFLTLMIMMTILGSKLIEIQNDIKDLSAQLESVELNLTGY